MSNIMGLGIHMALYDGQPEKKRKMIQQLFTFSDIRIDGKKWKQSQPHVVIMFILPSCCD